MMEEKKYLQLSCGVSPLCSFVYNSFKRQCTFEARYVLGKDSWHTSYQGLKQVKALTRVDTEHCESILATLKNSVEQERSLRHPAEARPLLTTTFESQW